MCCSEEPALSKLDLLVLTSLDQLLLILKKLQTCYVNEEVNGTSLPLQLVFPGCSDTSILQLLLTYTLDVYDSYQHSPVYA
jgi:hypothetical protein